MKRRTLILTVLSVLLFAALAANVHATAHKYDIGDTVMWGGLNWEKAPLNERIIGTIIDIKYDVPYSLDEGPNAGNPTHYFEYYIINFTPYYQEGALPYDNWYRIEFLDRNTELFKSETPISKTIEETPAFEAIFAVIAIILTILISLKQKNIE